jgi:uncharacterized protein
VERERAIEKTVEFVRSSLKEAEGGHDWWHIYRVWKTAQKIAEAESNLGKDIDMLVVELGALLHDIADSKFHDGNEEVGPQMASQFLRSIDIDEEIIYQIENIIKNISFKGGAHVHDFSSVEMNIVQDADRLDAIGAIGIARVFNYGGHKNRAIYDPSIKPQQKMTKEEYKNSTAPSLNHFYEKLLLLKDLMNTESGKRIAEQRHKFMEEYLSRFFLEWEGKE